MTDKELDEVIIRNINQVEIPFEIDVDEIISTAESKKKRKKIKVISIVACVMLILAVVFSIAIYREKGKNNIEINANDKENNNAHDEVQAEDEYGIINSDYMNGVALYAIPDIKETFQLYTTNPSYKGKSGIVIAKVEDIKYTNYDKDDEAVEHYTFVRSIANIKILKSIEGIFKEGDTVEIRAKGGIIEYNQYIKEFEQYNSSPSSVDSIVFEQEYKKLIEEGKTKIYVSEYRKLDTKLEKGKTYIMFVFQRNWGDYWIETSNTLLREYNEENNTVLNNETGEYNNLGKLLEEK